MNKKKRFSKFKKNLNSVRKKLVEKMEYECIID